jgi:CubicO group peptidase (beta-lactamase class C family)
LINYAVSSLHSTLEPGLPQDDRTTHGLVLAELMQRMKQEIRITSNFGREWLTVGLTLVLLTAANVRATGALDKDKAARINELVSRYEQCGLLNGAVLVAQHGKVLYANGIGEANMQSHEPNTPQTRFGIASITKQFTAVLALQQVALGKLRLDGTVSEYLPWYRKDTGQQMTVEQLLHHTSGLPPDYDSPAFSDSAEATRHYEPQAFAEKFCQPDLIAKPGTKWAYSNCGYVLVGLILERVTGRSFGDLLNEQILIPLGMSHTSIGEKNLNQNAGAAGYTRHAGPRYTAGPNLNLSHIFAAGAMYSTVEDLLLWNQALSSDNLLSSDLRGQLFTPGLGNWAYGWFVTKIPAGAPGAGSTVAEMRGDMPGNFFAWMLRYPQQDSVIIVLRNGYGSTEHLEEKLQAILFGQRPPMPARSPKDIFAHAWLVAYAFVDAHRIPTSLALLLVLVSFRLVSRRKARLQVTPPVQLPAREAA